MKILLLLIFLHLSVSDNKCELPIICNGNCDPQIYKFTVETKDNNATINIQFNTEKERYSFDVYLDCKVLGGKLNYKYDTTNIYISQGAYKKNEYYIEVLPYKYKTNNCTYNVSVPLIESDGDIVCNGLINTNDKYVCSMAHRNEIKTLYIVISVLGLFALITIIRLSIHIYQGRLVRKKRHDLLNTHLLEINE